MLRAILNKSWRQHPTRHQLSDQLPPITKTTQVRRTRHAGHCWRSKDELISDVLLWTPAYGQAKEERASRTYIQQLCEDTGCNSEDLPKAMNDREKWRERVRDIRASGTTWWWWWLLFLFRTLRCFTVYYYLGPSPYFCTHGWHTRGNSERLNQQRHQLKDVMFSFAFNVPLVELTSMSWVIILHEYKSLTHKLHSSWDRVTLSIYLSIYQLISF